jgi:hypothetical protein
MFFLEAEAKRKRQGLADYFFLCCLILCFFYLFNFISDADGK